MPTRELNPHPATPCAAVRGIEVEVELAEELYLCYRIHAMPQALRLPTPRAPGRCDGLWRHTCCELFVADADGGYREFHFAPSGEWAAYRFDRYREGMHAYATAAPRCLLHTGQDALVLEAWLPADTLDAPRTGVLRLALACVIEAADGTLSYWALHHPVARPDFHHADSFALELETRKCA